MNNTISNARKGDRETKQQSRPNLFRPIQRGSKNRWFSVTRFKKKMNQSDFFKKKSKIFYWSRKYAQLCGWALHWTLDIA